MLNLFGNLGMLVVSMDTFTYFVLIEQTTYSPKFRQYNSNYCSILFRLFLQKTDINHRLGSPLISRISTIIFVPYYPRNTAFPILYRIKGIWRMYAPYEYTYF